MPNPTVGAVHINRPLSDVVIAYVQDQTEYIGPKAAPIVPVDKQTDHYFAFDKESLLRNDAKPRADGAESAKSDFKVSKDTYDCPVTAVHIDLGPQTRANADDELELEESTSMIVGDKILMAQEANFAAKVMKAGVWGTDLTGGSGGITKWSSFGTSDPLKQVRDLRAAIKKRTGKRINKGILGYEVAELLKSHPVIKDQIKYTTAKTMTLAMLAELLEVDELLVADAIQATHVEGDTAAYDFTIAGNSVWFGYVNPRPAKMQPSAMYTFAWKGMAGGLGETIQIGREEVPLTSGAVRIEAQAAWDFKVTGPDLGAFIQTII